MKENVQTLIIVVVVLLLGVLFLTTNKSGIGIKCNDWSYIKYGDTHIARASCTDYTYTKPGTIKYSMVVGCDPSGFISYNDLEAPWVSQPASIVEVLYQFDDDPAVVKKVPITPYGHVVLAFDEEEYTQNTRDFIQNLMNKDTLVLSRPDDKGETQTLKIPLKGSKQAIQPVVNACYPVLERVISR